MADSVSVSWEAASIRCAAQLVTNRLLSCSAQNRPSTREQLASFAKAATRNGVKFFAFSPMDVMFDLQKLSKVKAAELDELQQLLQDAELPESGMQPVPPTQWPAFANYCWRMQPPTSLSVSALASWICARSSVHMPIKVDAVLEELIGPGKICTEVFSGKLQYSVLKNEEAERASTSQPNVPWKLNVQRPLKGPLTVQAALLISLPETCPGYSKVQDIRKKHDPAFERWMPHINIIYPFLPAGDFKLSVVQRKLLASGVAPFELCLNAIGHFEQVGNYHLKADEDGSQKLRCLRENLFAALPTPPGGSWTQQSKNKGKGKGKGRRGEPSENHGVDGDGFKPHMTVAKVQRGGSVVNIAQLTETLLEEPIRFRVERVSLCERTDNTPFKEVAFLSLEAKGWEKST